MSHHVYRLGMWLAMIGIILTAAIAEMCRYGYIPSDDETVYDGLLNPYVEGSAGCEGTDANKLWSFQACISFTTLLLLGTVAVRSIVALQETVRTQKKNVSAIVIFMW